MLALAQTARPEDGRPSRLLRMADIRRRRVGQPLCILFVRSGFAEIARHGFLPLFAIGFIQIQTLFSRYSTPPTLKHDTVFRSSLFSDSQIPWHRLRHELSWHGSHQKARNHLWICGGRGKTRLITCGRRHRSSCEQNQSIHEQSRARPKPNAV